MQGDLVIRKGGIPKWVQVNGSASSLDSANFERWTVE